MVAAFHPRLLSAVENEPSPCRIKRRLSAGDSDHPCRAQCPALNGPQQCLACYRILLGLRQTEAARQLGVSDRTLSLWECDRTYPTWPFQPPIVQYLGYDPFGDPSLGMPKGNESEFIAVLPPDQPVTLGLRLRRRRLELRKNKQEFANELGVSVRTFRDWELNRRRPCSRLQDRILQVLQSAPGQGS